MKFHKYQGTGNDFVILDNRNLSFPKDDQAFIERLCDRKFGIGADGLMLLENAEGYDFKMVYFNSDGRISTMCGNGGRCLVAFAKKIGVINQDAYFIAADGPHKASIAGEQVILEMSEVSEVHKRKANYFLNTGSPHHVQFTENLKELNVKKEGAKLRYGLYGAAGANINFVKIHADGTFSVRTYERGVEGETLSCGTGVTASAIALYEKDNKISLPISIKTLGGSLKVNFIKNPDRYSNVTLEGPAVLVFKGEL